MTIRYECQECSSVLKIKDEKAGQPGKCPKCKTRFTVPQLQQAEDDPWAGITADQLVDMPLELTPTLTRSRPHRGGSDDFDPMGVLNSDSADGLPAAAAAATEELRPSVTELMREHQEKMAKRDAKRAKRAEQQKKANPLLTAVETSGSAADAITRTYEKKREEGPDGKPVSRKERRAAEDRAAFHRFALQAAGVAVLVVGFAWGLFSYMLGGGGPDLVQVTGKVSVPGQSMAGFRINFELLQTNKDEKLAGGSSSARLTPDGEFTLMYNANTPGAIPGTYRVSMEDSNGLPRSLPEEMSRREVKADEENRFEFNL